MHRRATVTAALTSLLILSFLLVSGVIGIESAYADGTSGGPPVETPPPPKSAAIGGLEATSADVIWVVIGGVVEVVLLTF